MLNQNQFEQLMNAIKETKKELLVEIKKVNEKVDKNTQLIINIDTRLSKIESLPTILKEVKVFRK